MQRGFDSSGRLLVDPPSARGVYTDSEPFTSESYERNFERKFDRIYEGTYEHSYQQNYESNVSLKLLETSVAKLISP